MTLLVFELFIVISHSREIRNRQVLLEDCQKPEGYTDIQDSSELNENAKLYSCQKEFNNQINIKNCVLTMVSCTFTDIELKDNVFGIVYINVENFPADLTEDIEIKTTTFNSCSGGCIFFISKDESKSIKINECIFKSSSAPANQGIVKIEAYSGEINTCQFINNKGQTNAGMIYYKQPDDVGEKNLKLIITNNVFEHKDTDTTALISLEHNYYKIEITKNQFKIADNVQYMYILYSPNDYLNQFQNWVVNDNCMKTVRKEIIMEKDDSNKDAQQSIIDTFTECPAMECPPIPDPNSKYYIISCDSVYDESTQGQKDSLVSFYYCTFKSITNFDTKPGGAVYISTSDNINRDIKLPIKIYNCEFTYCTSTRGGAISIESTETSRLFDIKDCTFIDNHGKASESDQYSDENYGGAIYINARLSSVLISDSNFESNKAGNGAAIAYLTDSSSVSSSQILLENEGEIDYSLKIVTCTFLTNYGDNNGGGLYISLMNGDPSKKIEIIKCKFDKNLADEWDLTSSGDEVLPESGGAIYFEYNQKTSLLASFAFIVNDCDFIENHCSHLGGAICILIKDNELTNPIEINHCTFSGNYAVGDSESTEIEGFGSDIYYSLSSASSSKTLLETNPSLQIIDCEFLNGRASKQGNSLYFTVQKDQTSRPIEITKCNFKKDEYSQSVDGVYFINMISNQQNQLFHFSDCQFSGKCTLYFNAVSGLFDYCTFDDVLESNAIYYDCNNDVAPNGQHSKLNTALSFKIVK